MLENCSVSLDGLFCDISEFEHFVLCEYFWSLKIVPHISFDFYCMSMHKHIGTHIPIWDTDYEQCSY